MRFLSSIFGWNRTQSQTKRCHNHTTIMLLLAKTPINSRSPSFHFPYCSAIFPITYKKKTNLDYRTVKLCCYFFFFSSISIFVNFPNTGWCLYAHLVPEGMYKVHSSNMDSSKIMSGILTLSISIMDEWMVFKDLQSSKASSPMLVTLLGMVILVREEQPLNADCPIFVTLLGISIDVRLEHK